MKHIVCYSGGHSSALVAVEVVRKFGKENVILLNHDIHFSVEHADIKRFKKQVAEYLEIPITYANHPEVYNKDQFDIVVEAGAFKVDRGSELCTSRLKTEPFMNFLKELEEDTVSYYGFDSNETARIQRRSSIMGALGYKTDYPLALWQDRTISNIEEVCIERPLTYGQFKHGNCIGCLKAGWQHWYIVYCTRPDIWLKAKWAEDEIGFSIHYDKKPVFLEDMEERFEQMKRAGVEPTENTPHQTFWANARKVVRINEELTRNLPCECTF